MRTLLIDTCGETGSLALAEDEKIVAKSDLAPRTASSALLPAIKVLLSEAKWDLKDLAGIGVVTGPGSFTGVRVGLAAAKGLCEALQVPLAAISRLRVLAEAAGLRHGFAVLDAGRGDMYVRQIQGEEGREMLCAQGDFAGLTVGEPVAVAEEGLAERLGELKPEVYRIGATAALPLVLQALKRGQTEVVNADANYVRSESMIYGNKARME